MEALKLIAILSKWTNLETNTDEMYKCFQYLLYQLSSKLISNHDTLLLLISAVDLRSINPSASTLLREWFRARHSWPVDPDVSRGAMASLRWRRACGLQCQLYRTPHIVVKWRHFYTRRCEPSIRSQLACGLPASHTSAETVWSHRREIMIQSWTQIQAWWVSVFHFITFRANQEKENKERENQQ